MTQQYLIGELSLRLQRLQAVASASAASDVAGLCHEVETGSVACLARSAASAIALADRLCWRSLSCGDVTAFTRQAEVSADLHLFGLCAHLIGDS